MARPSFRDRFLTPPVARAIMSPLGIVLFGAAAAGAILIGAPIVAAAGIGAVAWGGPGARRRSTQSEAGRSDRALHAR